MDVNNIMKLLSNEKPEIGQLIKLNYMVNNRKVSIIGYYLKNSCKEDCVFLRDSYEIINVPKDSKWVKLNHKYEPIV